METEEQVAQLKKEKAEVECQLKVALGRIVELGVYEKVVGKRAKKWYPHL